MLEWWMKFVLDIWENNKKGNDEFVPLSIINLEFDIKSSLLIFILTKESIKYRITDFSIKRAYILSTFMGV